MAPDGPPSQPGLDGYERLAGLLERELALVASGGLDALADLAQQRAALVAGLPDIPPADARAALERCQALAARIGTALARLQDTIGTEVAQIDRVSRVAGAYRPARTITPRLRASA